MERSGADPDRLCTSQSPDGEDVLPANSSRTSSRSHSEWLERRTPVRKKAAAVATLAMPETLRHSASASRAVQEEAR